MPSLRPAFSRLPPPVSTCICAPLSVSVAPPTRARVHLPSSPRPRPFPLSLASAQSRGRPAALARFSGRGPSMPASPGDDGPGGSPPPAPGAWRSAAAGGAREDTDAGTPPPAPAPTLKQTPCSPRLWGPFRRRGQPPPPAPRGRWRGRSPGRVTKTGGAGREGGSGKGQ